jgi:DNA-binding NtrC family response regulator
MRLPAPPNTGQAPTPVVSAGPVVGFHGAVTEFKRRLIEATLSQMGGNRTRTARALGLQRTYLLRLMREFGITGPPAPSAVGKPAGPPAPWPGPVRQAGPAASR